MDTHRQKQWLTCEVCGAKRYVHVKYKASPPKLCRLCSVEKQKKEMDAMRERMKWAT